MSPHPLLAHTNILGICLVPEKNSLERGMVLTLRYGFNIDFYTTFGTNVVVITVYRQHTFNLRKMNACNRSFWNVKYII